MKTKLYLYQLIACVFFFATTCLAQDGATRTETVTGIRPVADAVLVIEQAYLVPINYEDIYYTSPDIVYADRAIMKDWTVNLRNDVTFQSPWNDRKRAALDALTDLLERHKQATGYIDVFAVVDMGDRLAVIPRHSPKLGGEMEQTVPLLDTRITLPAENRDGQDLTKALAEQVSTISGVKLLDFTEPLFQGHQTLIGASNETARAVLMRLIKEVPVNYLSPPNSTGGSRLMPTTISWQILCDEKTVGGCGINMHIVAPKVGSETGMKPATPAN